MGEVNKTLKGDKVIWIVAMLLGIISLVVVYSATSALVESKYGGSTGRLLIKHAGTLLIGYAMMFAAYRCDYKKFSKAFEIILYGCIPLLIYTLFFGKNLNNASRTINLLGMSFQPSEVAKIALITYLSRELVLMRDNMNDFKQVFIKMILPILVTVGLIFTENLSTAAMLMVACIVLLFMGRVKFKYLLALAGIGLALVSFYVLGDMTVTGITNHRADKKAENIEVAATQQSEDGQKQVASYHKISRIETWINRIKAMSEEKKMKENGTFDPFDGHHYQQTYAKIAVASSGVIGKGPGKSEQRNFLPHPYSDFIFAIIIEEYGLAGALLVMLLYIILLTRALKIVNKRPMSFRAYMAFGLAFLMVMQAMINMGVSVGLLPVTGQPLPFISMGGSSIMATGVAIGMILSVTKSIDEETEPYEGERDIKTDEELEQDKQNTNE